MSIDTALDYLVQQIYATWQNKDSVAMLQLLDMTGAFDRVVPALLLHNLREREIPELILKWVNSFISKKTMTLCLPGYNCNTFSINTGIPHGSPLSQSLFLFYNANLINACNEHTSPSSGIGFVDNVNALALSKKTEENCRML